MLQDTVAYDPCSSVGLIVVFTIRQRVGNRDATSGRERAVMLVVVATLPPLYATVSAAIRDPTRREQRCGRRSLVRSMVLRRMCCLTADGRLVLLHDPWLSSSTTLRGWAHQTAWGDLRGARLRDRDGAPTAETPMLLEELLDDAPGDLRGAGRGQGPRRS